MQQGVSDLFAHLEKLFVVKLEVLFAYEEPVVGVH